MSEPSSLPALVVGAGPSGLMMAAELCRLGVRCRLIDKRPGAGTHSRAIAVQARTLEIFDAIGIARRLIDKGITYHGATAYAGTKRLVHLSLDELESPFPFALGVPQTDTEATLTEHLASFGMTPEWTTELTEFRDEPDAVRATIRRPDGSTEVVTANWLVGCDGAHSLVRKGLNLAFEGVTYQQGFGLADVHVEWHLGHDEALLFPGPDGLFAAFPLPGDARYRLIWDTEPARAVNPGDEIKHGQVSAAEQPDPTLDDVQHLLNTRVGFPATARDPIWTANFRVNSRLSSAYRKGRCFLVGDAAHIHSPAGGQGMNTGLQDAFNLAWKLAAAERGQATAVLLDSYHAERHGVGVSLLKNTDRLAHLVMLRHPVATAIRNTLAPILSSLEVVQQRARQGLSEVAVTYRNSPAVADQHTGLVKSILTHGLDGDTLLAWRDFAAGPHAGDRAPDGGLTFPGSAGESRAGRFFSLLRNPTRHLALLFAGRAAGGEAVRGLARLGQSVSEKFGRLVEPWLVISGDAVPADVPAAAKVCLDHNHRFHDRFGARASCVYLIRPDGYIGFRSQPADLDLLAGYLGTVFVV